jgi:two-component system response regulator DesR
VIRTLLAMQGGLIRGGLAYVLGSHEDIEVVGEVDDLAELFRVAERSRPDVVVLGTRLLGLDPPAKLNDVIGTVPGSSVLVLVEPRRAASLATRAALGPSVGFLSQTVSPRVVVDGVRRMYRHEPVVDADLVIAALRQRSPLSARELQVLEVTADGLPVKEVAAALGLAPGTVRNHLSRIIAKTGARTRIEAIQVAREAGWI